MLKKLFPKYSSNPSLKKLALGGLGSFIMVLLLPKSTKFFIRHWFATIAKNILIMVLAGLLSQKFANKIIEYDSIHSERPSE